MQPSWIAAEIKTLFVDWKWGTGWSSHSCPILVVHWLMDVCPPLYWSRTCFSPQYLAIDALLAFSPLSSSLLSEWGTWPYAAVPFLLCPGSPETLHSV